LTPCSTRRICSEVSLKYAIYEHPVTHRFALIHLPDKFVEGDKVPVLPDDRWFDSREEAVAVLPELLDLEG
jgi:hypothetical protein